MAALLLRENRVNVMKETIKLILSQREVRRTPLNNQSIPAAVIIPLYRKSGEWFVLFTKRTQTVDSAKGHISFPGGMCENEDRTMENTARREMFEELGIATSDIEILGRLDDQRTGSGDFVITPFVGILSYPYTLNVNHDEVAEVVEVPIGYLLNRDNLKEGVYLFQNRAVTARYWQYNNHLIWGVTALILQRFLDLVFPEGCQG